MDPNSSIISATPTPQSADGTLVVMVCRAKHLPNRRKLDKQSPYVTLRLGTTAKKTPSHFRAGQTPDWTHEIRFDLSRDRKPIIKLDVLDETKNDPTPIGTCDIDCSVIFAEENHKDGKYIHDKWYELSLNGRRAGTIYLEMTFYPSAPVLPPKLYEEMNYETNQMSNSNGSSLSYKSLPPPPPQHPSQSRQPSVVDDIFVNASPESKRKAFFRNLASPQGNAIHSTNSNEEANNDVFVSSDPSPDKKKKYYAKFNKLKSKFQSKEPISHLWSAEERERVDRAQHISPINLKDFDNLDELERDIQKNSPRAPLYRDNDDLSFDRAPSPPPHSDYTPDVFPSSITGVPSPKEQHDYSPDRAPRTPKKQGPSRKPPPSSIEQQIKVLSLGSPNTSVPYSADTIGLEEDGEDCLPTKVYFMDQQVKSLSYSSLPLPAVTMNQHEIDPKYYAPTPEQHFGKNRSEAEQRKLDFRTKETGYVGNGKWDARFSPSIFDRVVHNDENLGFENKPHVPPKIPQGMNEREYYVLEKEKYLKDINGRRT